MAAPAAAADAERLAELYRRQDCFGLRDALAGMQGGAVVDFYRAAAAVAFNRPDEAIAELRLYIEPTSSDSDRFYGNIGQDVIRQFEAMTLDFRRMQLRFR